MCVLGICIAIGGTVMLGLISTVSFAPEGYIFRDRSNFAAVVIVISGFLIGSIGWWFRSLKQSTPH